MKILGGVAATIAMTLSLTGCGDKGAEERKAAEAKAAASSAAAEASQSAAAEKARADRIAREQAAYDACTTLTGDLIDALKQVDSRLSIGLNQDEYGDLLGDVQVEYDDLASQVRPDVDADTQECITDVAVPLERAFNRYVKVNNAWSRCISDYNCDFNEGAINRRTQVSWLLATNLIAKAEKKLAGLEPDDEVEPSESPSEGV